MSKFDEVAGLRGTVQDITERKLSEEQARFQSILLDSVGQAVISTDTEGSITYMNRAAELLYGWRADEAVGRSVVEVTVPLTSHAQAVEIMAELAQGRVWSGEFPVQHRDGTIFWAEVHATPVLDRSGKMIGIVGVSSDITKRKTLEAGLRDKEYLLTESQRIAHIGGWSWDLKGAIKWAQETYRIYGVSPETFIPTIESLIKLVHPEDRKAMQRWIEACASGAKPTDLEFRAVLPDGSVRALIGRSELTYDAGNKPAVMSGTVQDITEIKLTESSLDMERSKLAAIIENVPVGFILCNAQGGDISMNAAALRLFGYASAKDLHRKVEENVNDWELHYRDGRIIPYDEWPLVRAIRGDFVSDLELHGRNTSRGNTWICNLSIRPVRDSAGEVILIVQTLFDITANKHLEQALLEKNTELENARFAAEQANLAKSNFLSSMSHELRTPLNAILGFAQLLEAGSPPLQDTQIARLQQISKAGWFLLELINEILDLAKVESGHVPLTEEPVSLAEVMRECRYMIESQAQTRGIQVNFLPFDGTWYVHADRTRLQQVIVNLLSNAIKYNRAEGTVEVRCTCTPERIRINIKDSGMGLSPELQRQLFQPFNRLGQEGGAVEGTGIGLVVTKQLIEQMGGSIGVKSTVGVGSEFRFELPRDFLPQVVAGNIIPVDFAQHAQGNIQGYAAQRTLLYVEDNPANQMLVEQIIAGQPGLRMLSARDGNSGLALARTHLPDVILMDINLPGISGIEAMNILHQDPATAHIPIVALSANAMLRDKEQGLEAGFIRYLTKPIKVNEFMATLDEVLESSKRKPINAHETGQIS